MDVSKLTKGQQTELLKSLINGKNNTSAEKATMYELMDLLAECEDRTEPYAVLICEGYAKIINIDTFGEDYRMRWAKIRYNGKGAYINNSAQGGRYYI